MAILSAGSLVVSLVQDPKWSELALFLNPLIEQIEAFDTELCYHERHQNLTQDV